jgi:uncharacterized membrane protein required for colicin V production
MTPVTPADVPAWVLGCAAFWILGCVWMGIRRGVIRQAAAIAALYAAFYGAFKAGPLLAPIVPPLGFPVFVRPAVAGVVAGLLIWFFLSILSAILFKRTSEQSFGLIRFLYGFFGAVLGLLFGVSVLGLIAWTIRLSGSFQEGVLRSLAQSPAKLRRQLPEATQTLLSLKQAVDQTPASDLLKKVDPLSPGFYKSLEKAGQLLGSPEALERLWIAPRLQSITRHPKAMALHEDPEVQNLLRSGKVVELLRHPKVRAAFSDTALLTSLSTIPIEQEIDEALHPPGSDPTPDQRKEPPKKAREPAKPRPQPPR